MMKRGRSIEQLDKQESKRTGWSGPRTWRGPISNIPAFQTSSNESATALIEMEKKQVLD